MNNLSTDLKLDSVEVARMIGKRHSNLLRDIRTYISYLTQRKIEFSVFFEEACYIDPTGRELTCYRISKKGCEFIAHKLTGQKGAEFTATYINKFHEMEKQLQPQSQLDILRGMIDQLELAQKEATEAKQIAVNTNEQLTVTNHRLDSLDAVNLEGDLRQRLNKMVRKYAWDNGIDYRAAWSNFVQNFNTAYHTNLELHKTLRYKATGKELSTPAIIEEKGMLEDAIRVADKMLN